MENLKYNIMNKPKLSTSKILSGFPGSSVESENLPAGFPGSSVESENLPAMQETPV